MGTSVSQPSPSGLSAGGPEWTDAKETIKEGAPPRRIVEKILSAFGAEYGEEARDVLVDPGVEKVAEVLRQKLTTNQDRNETLLADFITDARRELALGECNSFFAEVALSAGSKAILQGGESGEKAFAAEFAYKVIDYVVSRDLPSTIGSRGLTNLESVHRLLGEVAENFKERANATREGDPIRILQNLLSIPMRRDNE